MGKRPLHLDVLTENILGVQQYQYHKEERQDKEYRQMINVLKDAMEGELTPRQLYCMHAYYFENKTQAEIAQEIGIGISAVNKHIKKAKERLYKVMRYFFERLR